MSDQPGQTPTCAAKAARLCSFTGVTEARARRETRTPGRTARSQSQAAAKLRVHPELATLQSLHFPDRQKWGEGVRVSKSLGS